MKLYRASSSSKATLRTRGFSPFKPMQPAQIRALVNYLNGGPAVANINTNQPGLSLYAKDLLKTFQDWRGNTRRHSLGDLSQVIRNAGSHNVDAFWVSMSLDPTCKGQVLGRSIYEVDINMNVHRPAGNGLWGVATLRQATQTKAPFLLADGNDSCIALLHCQEGGKVEVSVLTRIPGNLIFPKVPSRDGRGPPPQIRRNLTPPTLPSRDGRGPPPRI